MRQCLAITVLAILTSACSGEDDKPLPPAPDPQQLGAHREYPVLRDNVSLGAPLNVPSLLPSHQCACGNIYSGALSTPDSDLPTTTTDLLSEDPATTLRLALKAGCSDW